LNYEWRKRNTKTKNDALLALNVSKDAVEAFKLVDKSLTKTTENFTVKNDMIYQQFDQAASENPQKAGPWKNIAYDVKERANEMFEKPREQIVKCFQKTEKSMSIISKKLTRIIFPQRYLSDQTRMEKHLT